jgi:glutaredoxin 2
MVECGIGEDKVKLDVVNVMAGENRSPEFIAKNPQGTVPALALADGRVMAESTMICQYLDEIHGPTSECCRFTKACHASSGSIPAISGISVQQLMRIVLLRVPALSAHGPNARGPP